jgi:hypothetical protein
MIYWYDPISGIIVKRSEGALANFGLPNFEKEEFDYSNYRVNIETKELIYEPRTIPGLNPR